MKKLLIILLLCLILPHSVWAADLIDEQADAMGTSVLEDELPKEASELLDGVSPTESLDFWGHCKRLFFQVLGGSESSLKSGLRLCAVLLAIVTLCAMLRMTTTHDLTGAISVVGSLGICTACVGTFHGMITLAVHTIQDLSNYTACLLPVMASASAMSGGMTSAGALYAGTVLFSELLMRLITKILIPLVYFYLAMSTAEAALSSDMLTELREFIGWLISKSLRIILYVFTGYMALTGVITGSSDAAALRATKAAVSGMVPVVGSILSDASETLLASASILKNSIGVFGMLAVLAICLSPFLRVGVQYLMLKVTAAVSGTVGLKSHVSLIKNFSAAMGYLLAMTGACALMLLISSVCFLRVVS